MFSSIYALCTEQNAAVDGEASLGIFAYLVLKAKIERLPSIVKYIEAFRADDQTHNENDFCFTQLQFAIQFLSKLNSETVEMNEQEFEM